MKLSRTLQKSDVKVMLGLAVPLIITGFLESSIGFTSNFYLAHLGPQYLAAGSLVAWFNATIMIILWGVLMAVSVLISHLDGAKDSQAIAWVLRDGIYLSVLLVVPTFILIYNLAPILLLLGQKPSLVVLAVPYMHALAWSVIPDFVGLCLLQFLTGLGHTRTYLLITLCWVPVNLLCNYMFTFGKLGAPDLGIAGLGWGTTISYWVTVIALVIYLPLKKCYRQYFWVFKQFSKPRYLGELLKVGLPIGFMWFVEVAFFFCLALIMGHHGVVLLDSSQITMQYVAFFVSIAFSVAQAITVRMGNQLGAKHYQNAYRALYAGALVSVLGIVIPVLLYWFAPQYLINLDINPQHTNSAAISAYVIKFFAIAAVFQLIEALRISLFGALRALKDTRFTLFTSFITFWCISLPIGYVLADLFHVGPSGYWWAMVLGAACNTLLLLFRYRSKFAQFIENQPAGSVS